MVRMSANGTSGPPAVGRSERANCHSYFKQGIDKTPTKPHDLAKRLKRLSKKMQERVADNLDIKSHNYAVEIGLRAARHIMPIATAVMRGKPMVPSMVIGEAITQTMAGQRGAACRPALHERAP